MRRRESVRSSRVFRRVAGRRARFLAASAVAAVPASAAWAGQHPAPAVQSAQDATRLRAVTVAFDIPAGSIDAVARAFERATSVRVTLSNADLGTLDSGGVHGVMTVEQGMRELLAGSALEPIFHADHIELVLARVSEEVSVVGVQRNTTTVSSPRYTVPLRDVAQTIALVPRTIIEQRAAATLTDVLRNVPGITLQAGEGGGASNTAGDMFNMRGFSANNSL